MAMIHNPSGGFVLEKFSAVVFLICLSGGSQYLHRMVAYMVGKKVRKKSYISPNATFPPFEKQNHLAHTQMQDQRSS